MNAAVTAVAPFDSRHLMAAKADGNGCIVLLADGEKERQDISLSRFLNEICLFHGSSLTGRTASFCRLIGHVYKPCILLDERSETIMLVVKAIEREDGLVVCYNDISLVRQRGDKTELIMNNGMILKTDASVRTIRRQMHRCDQFLQILDRQAESNGSMV